MRARTGISSRKAQNRTSRIYPKNLAAKRVFSLDGVLRYSCFSSPVSLIYYIYYYARCQLVAHFTFEIALSGAIMLTLLLVCSFSPRKYKSILRGFYNKESPERETNSLTSPGFSGILALRVSRTVASQDEESPSITRQGAGEIPVKATSRKVQQRYTARFIV